jgi:hypothetical protein
VIYRPLHPEPDTKNSSGDHHDPEGFFRNTPPLVYRFELVYANDDIGDEIENED